MEQLQLHVLRNACPLHTLFLLFTLESSWCHGLRTSAGRNGTVRRAGANPRRSKEFNVKRNVNLWHNLKSVMKPQRHILRSQAPRTDEKFPGVIHVSHQLALLHGHENVFFCTQCGAVNAGGSLRLLKSLLRRLWRISPESETQTRASVLAMCRPTFHGAVAQRTFHFLLRRGRIKTCWGQIVTNFSDTGKARFNDTARWNGVRHFLSTPRNQQSTTSQTWCN